ncbi:hypothetical protein PILCRDRAFT_816404 [Piloderma croceum F 1598]|uniref:Major facilitator superfamily (MFS) profile domain-containing protein n=1 Tax=Piloderma croceum (strain F 1598) TaxID=765440 RepID=A0A0C3BJC6_PILCF|nr:hypothetical protein PILCRDRAFT_816404 [Piloderma croceum F 1598]
MTVLHDMTNQSAAAETGYYVPPSPTLKESFDSDEGTIRVSGDDIKHFTTKAPVQQTEVPEDEYPDGGLRAWVVVFGTVCTMFSTFGYVNAWGVFQAYYEETLLSNSSPSDIAWIGSLQYALIFVPGMITGRMFDLGHFKLPFFISSCVLVAATFLVAECTQYWQFLLCQGFAVGLGCGAVFGPAMGIVSHWFKKRRGIALGIMTAGSSLGGTVFPIATRRLINEVGFPWTMRIIGLFLIFTLGCANLTLQRRLPPVNAKGGLFNLAAFKNKAFTFWCLAGFTTFLGLYTALTYIDVSATSMGIDPDFAFYLVSIANASSGVGRLFAGVMADRFGAINVAVPCTVLAGIITYIWPFVTTKASFIAISIIYGFGSGAFISLVAMPVIAFGDIDDVGRRVGMALAVLATGALAGPPISGAINKATGGFKFVGYYAGSMIVVSVIFMILARQTHLQGKLRGKF